MTIFVHGHKTIQEQLDARLTVWQRISREISVRRNGWIGRAGGGWQWQVELTMQYGQVETTLSPRQARLLAKALLRLADECERKNADEASHANA